MRLSSLALRFLAARGADAILLACGTASSFALPRISRDFPLPLFGALTPTAEGVAALCKDVAAPRVLLLATAGTVRAGVLSGEILAHCPDAVVTALPCPDFVPLAEARAANLISEGAATREAARVLRPLRGRHFDAIALGCTHFSALAWPIRRVLGGIPIADAAILAARAAASAIPPAKQGTGAGLTLYTSGDAASFARAARGVLGGTPEVLHVE